jgi:hypothetical protein
MPKPTPKPTPAKDWTESPSSQEFGRLMREAANSAKYDTRMMTNPERKAQAKPVERKKDAAAAKRNAVAAARAKAANKTKISEPDMSGFTDTWRRNYIEKQRATRGGEPLFSTEQLSKAYREEQRKGK